MSVPTFRGRVCPLNDWEGDDFTPGAGRKWVTCMDTSAGRAMAWATNNRVDVDGRTIRRHVQPPDPDGISFEQADRAVQRVNRHCRVEHPHGWTQAKVTSWLRNGRGLIVTGMYDTIPRAYRHQLRADFPHAMFVTHFDRTGTRMRLYDPLNPDTTERGRNVPVSILWPFLRSRGFLVGYVPLHPINL
jgi:hypothetical protein